MANALWVKQAEEYSIFNWCRVSCILFLGCNSFETLVRNGCYIIHLSRASVIKFCNRTLLLLESFAETGTRRFLVLNRFPFCLGTQYGGIHKVAHCSRSTWPILFFNTEADTTKQKGRLVHWLPKFRHNLFFQFLNEIYQTWQGLKCDIRLKVAAILPKASL